MKTSSILCLVAWFGGAVVSALNAAPVVVKSTDPLVRYVGRFDRADPAGPRAAWTASAVSVTFEGDSLGVEMSDDGRNFWQVVLDGEAAGVLELQAGTRVYPVVKDLPPGRHTVELVKRTEYSLGATQVRRFILPEDGKVWPTPARERRVLVIGDSISCGYGNEAPRKEDNFAPATENGWLAYGAVAARAVGADYVCIAWSGKKLWPDNSILDHYDGVLADPAAAKWDHAAAPAPDVVVINLGTNDFGRGNPERAGWVAAYVDFIASLREQYPGAPIYCAQGTMMSDWPEERKPRTTILSYLAEVVERANAAGGPPVRLIDFGVQQAENGIGANWHPSVRTNALMGAQLAEALRRDLGW